ncbi:sigma-70 family RNA polymerase sigma factor [Allorhizocola rhizosphaerae]|uniref:sigma-70 family RNA polymerase sigma factor n=1 Tax=Allorhizocola rhizosphaerae TaxID=1872709 RepID=UPI000E3D29DE
MRDANEFDEFYRTTSRRLLGYAYAVTKDWAQAQDLVQEAYLRAWRDWDKLSRYEDPEAWLRLVVVRLATDVWRRLARRRAAYERTAASQVDTAPPSEEKLLVAQALAALPKQQRQAITLHYLFDQPVARIAEDLRVAEGTVKSWLSRGRLALADLLDPDNERRLATSGQVRETADRRARRRAIAGTAAAVALLAAGIVWAVQGIRPDAPPVTPSPSPSVTPSATPAPSPSAGLPVASGCEDRYLRQLPVSLFPGRTESELCFAPKPTGDPVPERDHLPLPCRPMNHASDALIEDRRGFESFFEEGTADAPSPTFYSHTVTKYHPGGAQAYLAELRDAMGRCGAYTHDGARHDFTPVTGFGANADRLVIRYSRNANYVIVVERLGDYVIVIYDHGWEGHPSKDTTITQAIGQAGAAVRPFTS